jgi:RNA polymerase-binding transcription factor DksA
MAKHPKKSATKKAPAKPALKKHAPAPIKARAARHTPAPVKAKAARHAPAPLKTRAARHAPAAKTAPAGKPAKHLPTMEKPSKKNALRNSILKRKVAAKPIAFSLDEVRAIAKTVTSKTNMPFSTKTAKAAPARPATLERPAKPSHHKAASLSEILGFNPKRAKSVEATLEKHVPEKLRRYYKLLLDLRRHLTEGIERHSEETLKRSAKDDAGDLSAYGQHMADAGTDTFDRDFALSLVSSEQDALSEIDAAIKRVHDGSYGICEITKKPISKDRLLAVPFTRYSAEAQKNLERNRHHSRTQAGLFGELGEEGGKIADEDAGGDE